MTIGKSDPKRRKSFRARHNCDTRKKIKQVQVIGHAKNGSKRKLGLNLENKELLNVALV